MACGIYPVLMKPFHAQWALAKSGPMPLKILLHIATRQPATTPALAQRNVRPKVARQLDTGTNVCRYFYLPPRHGHRHCSAPCHQAENTDDTKAAQDISRNLPMRPLTTAKPFSKKTSFSWSRPCPGIDRTVTYLKETGNCQSNCQTPFVIQASAILTDSPVQAIPKTHCVQLRKIVLTSQHNANNIVYQD